MSKECALVTGGGGFLGRHVVNGLLERGFTVRILGRSPQPDLEGRGVVVFRGDLTDAELVTKAVEGCQAVFHVAARAGVWGDWDSYYRPNVLGTRYVLEACRRTATPYLVYTSTPSVVFTGEAFEGADESLPYGRNWLCPYPETKAMAEKEVLAAHTPGVLSTCALRPHLIWGSGDPHIVPRILQRARAGRLRIVGDGNNRVDITHVRNAAQAHLLALDALKAGRAGGKAYFISQGEPVLLWDWINTLLRGVGIPELTRKISLKRAYGLGAALEKIWHWLHLSGEPPMTRFVAVELAKSHWYDISAARRDLGYEPLVKTGEGLEEMIREEKARR